MSVEEKALSPPIRKNRGYTTKSEYVERHRKVALITLRLSDVRDALVSFQEAGDIRMYGEGLIEYARLLGELEGLMTNSGSYF